MKRRLTKEETNRLIITLIAAGVCNADLLEADGVIGEETINAILGFLCSPGNEVQVNMVISFLKEICPPVIANSLKADGVAGKKTRTAFAWILANNVNIKNNDENVDEGAE